MVNEEKQETKAVTINLPIDIYRLCERHAREFGYSMEERLIDYIYLLAEDIHTEQMLEKFRPNSRCTKEFLPLNPREI